MSLSITAFRKYAEAVGCELEIKLTPPFLRRPLCNFSMI